MAKLHEWIKPQEVKVEKKEPKIIDGPKIDDIAELADWLHSGVGDKEE